MPYADIPGGRLWFTDTGGGSSDKPPVVFLHAASGTSDSWGLQEPVFTEAGYRCVAYDRRNWGRSEVTDSAGKPGSASDDLEALADYLGLGRFHLVSTAAGGIVGLDYALEYPRRVISLVVSSSFTGVQDQSYLEVQHRPAAFGDSELAHRATGGGAVIPGSQPGRHGPLASDRGIEPP